MPTANVCFDCIVDGVRLPRSTNSMVMVPILANQAQNVKKHTDNIIVERHWWNIQKQGCKKQEAQSKSTATYSPPIRDPFRSLDVRYTLPTQSSSYDKRGKKQTRWLQQSHKWYQTLEGAHRTSKGLHRNTE